MYYSFVHTHLIWDSYNLITDNVYDCMQTYFFLGEALHVLSSWTLFIIACLSVFDLKFFKCTCNCVVLKMQLGVKER